MKKNIHPKSLGKEPATYSHGVLVSPSHFLFTAGQLAMNDKGEVIGKGDIEAQTKYIMENLKNILTEVEMDFSNVVRVNMYLVNMNDLPKVIPIRNDYLQPNRPAITAVEVAGLVNPDSLIEVEIVAAK